MRVLITAGFDGSKAAIALCELLTRCGHNVETVLVVTPFSVARLAEMLRQRGLSGVKNLARKLLRIDGSALEVDLLSRFLEESNIEAKSLRSWAKSNQTTYKTVKNLNCDESVDAVKLSSPDIVIYAGGGILRSSFIEAANFKIINNHSGPLPEIRGMNAVEWSVLLGHEPAASIHIIDNGIDTGKIISRRTFAIGKGATIESLRQRAVVAGLLEIIDLFDGLESFSALGFEDNKGVAAGRQCYIMAPAIRELTEKKLERILYA